MLEAVGKEYIEPYFKMIDEVLNESGVAVFQVITIPESRFENCEFSWGRFPLWVEVHGVLMMVSLWEQIRTMRISSRSGGEHDEIEM
jgi:cyclopropane fatty-acyl-phospholipid synthase-like methyltransferase